MNCHVSVRIRYGILVIGILSLISFLNCTCLDHTELKGKVARGHRVLRAVLLFTRHFSTRSKEFLDALCMCTPIFRINRVYFLTSYSFSRALKNMSFSPFMGNSFLLPARVIKLFLSLLPGY